MPVSVKLRLLSAASAGLAVFVFFVRTGRASPSRNTSGGKSKLDNYQLCALFNHSKGNILSQMLHADGVQVFVEVWPFHRLSLEFLNRM